MKDKSVLVIDTPQSCAECPLRTSMGEKYNYCIATLPRLKIDPMTIKHIKEYRCPLKPLPKKLPMKSKHMMGQHGWNECLDEILGETE